LVYKHVVLLLSFKKIKTYIIFLILNFFYIIFVIFF